MKRLFCFCPDHVSGRPRSALSARRGGFVADRAVATAALVVLAGLLGGCPPQRPPMTQRPMIGQTPPPADLPTYRQVVSRYNANVIRLTRLWARTEVELYWTEPDGKERFETGDGKLVIILPDRLAFSVGKLGNTVFWAGSDGQRHWLFDQQDDRTAYVGLIENIGAEGSVSTRRMPFPIRPAYMPLLLGLLQLDPNAPQADQDVEWFNGRYLIEPPGGGVRLQIDPKTYRPVRVDLLNARGFSRVVCTLSELESVELEDSGPGDGPMLLASRLDIKLEGQAASAVVELSGMTDASRRFNSRAFDFQTLVNAHKPKRIVNLDEGLAPREAPWQPAVAPVLPGRDQPVPPLRRPAAPAAPAPAPPAVDPNVIEGAPIPPLGGSSRRRQPAVDPEASDSSPLDNPPTPANPASAPPGDVSPLDTPPDPPARPGPPAPASLDPAQPRSTVPLTPQ